MDWKKLLGAIHASVDEELWLRNAYVAAENRMLRQQITGRVQLTDSDRKALAELGQQMGKQALEELATVAKPDTILAWHRRFAHQQCDRSQSQTSVGRPCISREIEDLVVRMARENRSWGYDESAKFRGDPLQQWALRPTLCAWNNTKHTRTSISCASSCEASVHSSGVDS